MTAVTQPRNELDETLDETSREFLMGLDEFDVIRAREFGILFTHFVYPDLTGNLQGSPSQRKDFIPHLKKMKAKKTVDKTGHLTQYLPSFLNEFYHIDRS